MYGSRLPFPVPGGIALHAAGLSLDHPVSGEKIDLASAAGPNWREAFPSLLSPPTDT
jgi:hypothetical protein